MEKFLNEIDADFFKENVNVLILTDSILMLVVNQLQYSFKIPPNFVTALSSKDYLFFKHFKNNSNCIYAFKLYKIFLHLNTTNRTAFTLLLIKLASKYLDDNTDFEIIDELIKDLARDYTKLNKAPLRKLLEKVINKTDSLRKAEECLCLIKEKQPLNQLEDFELILNVILKHKEALKVSDIFRLLSHFSGHLKKPKSEWVNFYLDVLEECQNQDQGLIGCQLAWGNCFDRHIFILDIKIKSLLHVYIDMIFYQKTPLDRRECSYVSRYDF